MLSDLGHPEGHETYRAARSVGERDRETQDTIKHTGGKKSQKKLLFMFTVSVILKLKNIPISHYNMDQWPY